MTQKTIGPLKLTMARPISAPYSSCIMRSDSGEPSNPDRFASTTRGRLPLAALMARAVFLDDLGNRVPAVHWSGPSAGSQPRRGIGRDSMPSISICLLYTSDAADDLLCVDLGGRRLIKTK